MEHQKNFDRDQPKEFVEKLIKLNRTAKVVKGGRRFSFSALTVVGDQKGRVGFGSGKASEVPEAITKATNEAKRNMIRIPLREGRTLHHDIAGRYGAGKVYLRTAPAGTGVTAVALAPSPASGFSRSKSTSPQSLPFSTMSSAASSCQI